MRSRARALGHGLHPMLIVFPLGLLVTAVVFDIVWLITDRDGFSAASGYMIAAGLIGGVLAALFGWVDWFAIPGGTRAKRLGLLHGLGNAVVLVAFLISWLLRDRDDAWAPGAAALVFSFLAVAIGGVTAWMGGELVERLGIGVEDAAHPDASSSLRGTAAATVAEKARS